MDEPSKEDLKKKELLEKIQTSLVADYTKRKKFPKMGEKEVKDYVNDFFNKYYSAPKEFIDNQRELMLDWKKKVFGFVISIFLAAIGVFISIIYVEVIRSWSGIYNLITTVFSRFIDPVKEDPVLWGNLFTLVFVILLGLMFYFGFRYVLFPIFTNFVRKRQSIGDIELFVMAKIVKERKRRDTVNKKSAKS